MQSNHSAYGIHGIYYSSIICVIQFVSQSPLTSYSYCWPPPSLLHFVHRYYSIQQVNFPNTQLHSTHTHTHTPHSWRHTATQLHSSHTHTHKHTHHTVGDTQLHSTHTHTHTNTLTTQSETHSYTATQLTHTHTYTYSHSPHTHIVQPSRFGGNCSASRTNFDRDVVCSTFKKYLVIVNGSKSRSCILSSRSFLSL